jgi:hypothetical protein
MLADILVDIYDKPCYLVKQGYGSSLTFELGEPSLKIREPKVSDAKSKRVRELFSLRNVTVRGAWHLWIYCCNWNLYMNNKNIASYESSDRLIEKALAKIEGQKITNIIINPENGNSVFEFDLGGRLETYAYSGEDLYEQWMVYEPSGNVLSIREDGKYAYQSEDTPPDKHEWNKI